VGLRIRDRRTGADIGRYVETEWKVGLGTKGQEHRLEDMLR
jgi:hypothetical protein